MCWTKCNSRAFTACSSKNTGMGERWSSSEQATGYAFLFCPLKVASVPPKFQARCQRAANALPQCWRLSLANLVFAANLNPLQLWLSGCRAQSRFAPPAAALKHCLCLLAGRARPFALPVILEAVLAGQDWALGKHPLLKSVTDPAKGFVSVFMLVI